MDLLSHGLGNGKGGVMNPEDEEFNRIEREASMRKKAVSATLAAQPAVPDVLTTADGEHPEYVSGWTDCRAEMLRMRNST